MTLRNHTIGLFSLVFLLPLAKVVKSQSCPLDWIEGPRNNCYKFVYNPKQTWANAQAKCVEEDANLIAIDSLEEVYFIRGYRSYNFDVEQDIWIGGYQENERWYWVGQSVFRRRMIFSDWSPNGEPNGGPGEFCASALNDRQDRPKEWHWKWNDIPCTRSKAYICEKPATRTCLFG